MYPTLYGPSVSTQSKTDSVQETNGKGGGMIKKEKEFVAEFAILIKKYNTKIPLLIMIDIMNMLLFRLTPEAEIKKNHSLYRITTDARIKGFFP